MTLPAISPIDVPQASGVEAEQPAHEHPVIRCSELGGASADASRSIAVYGPSVAPGEELSADETTLKGRDDLAHLLALVHDAFAQARESGKDDWHRMYAGVLKNRLLLLTDGEFDEAEWGATGFTSLLRLLSDDLRIDFSNKPPLVELLHPDQVALRDPVAASPAHPVAEHPTATHNAQDSRRWRIRRDLWDAVLAVRDPDAFVWEDGAVIRIPQDQAIGHAGARLPTLTGPELDAWQGEFAAEQPTDSPFRSVLDGWARGDVRTTALPRQLQHAWYGRLKRLVRERLEGWFEEHGFPLPADLIELPATARVGVSDSQSDLRAFVVACVEAMTEDELRRFLLPAEVVLRARRR
jgi:hypothetical protein